MTQGHEGAAVRITHKAGGALDRRVKKKQYWLTGGEEDLNLSGFIDMTDSSLELKEAAKKAEFGQVRVKMFVRYNFLSSVNSGPGCKKAGLSENTRC